jgi:hypothetical protein
MQSRRSHSRLQLEDPQIQDDDERDASGEQRVRRRARDGGP